MTNGPASSDSASLDAARRAEALGPHAIELTQALVRLNTVNRHSGDAHPGNEGHGQRLIRPLLEELGARTELFDCPADVYTRLGVLGPRDRDFSDRPNLLAELAYGAGGPTVVLQCHMDTVGVDDMTLDDPLSGRIEDGRLWGRGSSDMKGGLAAALTALQALHDVRHELHGRIVFASVVEEESNGSGAGALAWIDRARRGELFGGDLRPDGNGRLADLALCTDGSGPEVWRSYGGVLTVDVHVQGRSGHPARPGGVSAIEKALVAKEALDVYKAEREALGAGRNVNLGLFRGGTHPAVVAGAASMSLNMSYPAADAFAAEAAGHGFGNAPGRARFEQLVRERCAADPWLAEHPPVIDWIKDLIPFELTEDHPLVQDLAATHRRVLGQEPPIGVNPAWSDACYLPRFAGTPAVVCGAGVPGQAHTAAEYGETHRIVDCARVLAAFLYGKLRA
ncbi:MAG: Acetylornithine deacetylase [uncultured Chloroflexi bacterium]|uniref:Acetylornithine deacetylase n=1 Tax=uncultured Chloroflexota bacterium TaxID=166587 RepID=A0A6J4ICP6_9CHLR|nr:MAG: Acetylornithine deacetylase [uncultured Chloroflexota bacterium]